MIEKKIHYIWLGGKSKSKLTEVCINSWKRILPDYEIIEWNENNLNIEELCKYNKFLRKCYELKLWAFVSDYIRLYVLHKYGGIYLDTDVEVLRSYTPLLNNKVFMGYEVNDFIGTAVIGAEKNSTIIKRLLEFYDEEIWNVDFINNPIIFKYLLEREPDEFKECKIYPQNYFSPYQPNQLYDITVEVSETYSIHWYTQNWNMSRKGYIFIYTKHIKNNFKKFIWYIKKNIGYWRRR
ncbi:MAG: glycosyltransferase [Methanobacteriaceae archaeon]|nr:glycosyltransferase [Methanobacteriaceae archaeon]